MRLIFIVLFLATSTVSGRSHSHSRHSHSTHGHHSVGKVHLGFGSGSHHYAASTGHSGYGSGGAHSYPASTGMSGNTHSGHVQHTYHQQHNAVQNNYSPRLKVHHHYHYSPPQQINYGSTYHPVYLGHPPVYVYEYRDSGSRFDNLLTGLALYNLGRNSHSPHYSSERQYSGTPGEICKLGISKPTGEYEETRIDCNLMSSFIWEDTTSATRNEQHVVENTTNTTRNELHVMKNTTEVKVIQTVNGTGNSSVTTVSVTNNTVEDALKVKGPSIAVTPGMTCYMIRTFRDTIALRKPVDCGLLQEYARSSLHRSVAQCLMPLKTIIFSFLIIYLLTY